MFTNEYQTFRTNINEYEAINHGMKALQIIITNRNTNIQRECVLGQDYSQPSMPY